jgi:hypothetical protein
MLLTIDIKDNIADKILYFLNSFKDDIKIIDSKTDNQSLEIESIEKNESDYQIILKARKERKTHSENYGTLDDYRLGLK